MNNVFQNIKKMREMRNYKQEYMAQRLDMSLRWYNDIETGKAQTVQMKQLQAIADILEVELSDLIASTPSTIFLHCKNQNGYIATNMTIQQGDMLQQMFGLLKEVLQELRQKEEKKQA